jgi:hypothetical protein
MKKIFTLLAAAFVTITSFAAPNDGRITINDYSKKQLWFEVDGKRYNDNDQQVVISNLRPGMHSVVVYAQQRYNDWSSIFGHNNRRQIVYQSNIQVKARQNIIISIDRQGRVSIDERRMNNGRNERNGRNRDDDWSYYDERDTRDYDNDRFDPSRSAMDAQSFEMLKRALSRENFEKSRLEIAKNSIDRNNFSSMQVRELALLFAFESSKLDITKYAFGKVVDKNNFYHVYDVFSFSSSKEELASYTRKY